MKYLKLIYDLVINNRDKVLEILAWLTTAVGGIYLVYFYFNLDKNSFALSSQLGDFIGGVIGTIFLLATIILLFANLYQQKKELSETRTELAQTREITHKQQFENTFFKLLENHDRFLRNQNSHESKDTNYEVLSLKHDVFIKDLMNYRHAATSKTFPNYTLFDYDRFNIEQYREEVVIKFIKNINFIISYIEETPDSVISDKLFYHNILLNTLRNNEINLLGYQELFKLPSSLNLRPALIDIYCLNIFNYLTPMYCNLGLYPPKIMIGIESPKVYTKKIHNLENGFPKFIISNNEQGAQITMSRAKLINSDKTEERLDEEDLHINEYEQKKIILINALDRIFKKVHQRTIESVITDKSVSSNLNYTLDFKIEIKIWYQTHTFTYKVRMGLVINNQADSFIYVSEVQDKM